MLELHVFFHGFETRLEVLENDKYSQIIVST